MEKLQEAASRAEKTVDSKLEGTKRGVELMREESRAQFEGVEEKMEKMRESHDTLEQKVNKRKEGVVV